MRGIFAVAVLQEMSWEVIPEKEAPCFRKTLLGCEWIGCDGSSHPVRSGGMVTSDARTGGPSLVRVLRWLARPASLTGHAAFCMVNCLV